MFIDRSLDRRRAPQGCYEYFADLLRSAMRSQRKSAVSQWHFKLNHYPKSNHLAAAHSPARKRYWMIRRVVISENSSRREVARLLPRRCFT